MNRVRTILFKRLNMYLKLKNALAAFLAVRHFNVKSNVIEWIHFLLKSRIVKAENSSKRNTFSNPFEYGD